MILTKQKKIKFFNGNKKLKNNEGKYVKSIHSILLTQKNFWNGD